MELDVAYYIECLNNETFLKSTLLEQLQNAQRAVSREMPFAPIRELQPFFQVRQKALSEFKAEQPRNLHSKKTIRARKNDWEAIKNQIKITRANLEKRKENVNP